MTLRDQNFFFDCASNDLTPGQIYRMIVRPWWPESDIEICELDLEKYYESTRKTSKRPC